MNFDFLNFELDQRLVILFAFAALALLVTAIGLFIRDVIIRRRQVVSNRLRGDRVLAEDLPRLPVGPEPPPARTMWGRMNQWFTRLEQENGTDQPPDAVFLWELVVGLAVGGLFYLWQRNIIAGVVGMILGMASVTIFFVIQRNRRRRLIQEQLPDVMELLARAVRAGETLDQAIGLVGETADEPLRSEFVRFNHHLNMGLSMEGSIRSLTRRAPLPETRILAATLMVQRRAGGSLPITLERLARVIRDRISYQRQFRAATAAGRMSMFLILLLGPLVFAYMWFFQRDYIQDFISTPQGYFLLVVAVLLQIVGSIWVFALLRSDY
jgi:tight adherence protein B